MTRYAVLDRVVVEADGYNVEDPDELHSTLKEALSSDGPSLVDIVTQQLQDAKAPVSKWIA